MAESSRKYIAVGIVVGLIALAIVFLLLWLYKLNRAMSGVPEMVLEQSPNRWTKQEILETYERVKDHPKAFTEHLPPKLERRYVVVGGSGLVGGQIVLQLLDRGQPPESIRIVDFQKLSRDDMLRGPASAVEFIQTDISSPSSTSSAFSRPWPASVAKLPLTVFHTAAVIRPSERSVLFYDRCTPVNVGGTVNVLTSAKAAGADVFVATSSAGIALLPTKFWGAPWKKWPDNYAQVYDEDDFFRPLREHSEYFSNYARSKAEAERIVCAANEPGFRTGCIRPANGIYGHRNDLPVGGCLKLQKFPSWMNNSVQSFVHAGNVSLGHLLFEAALLRTSTPSCAGRPFNITDPNPPPSLNDAFTVLAITSVTPFRVIPVPPVIMLIMAHLVEAYCILLARVPFLGKVLKEPQAPLHSLQPSVFTPSTHCIGTDGAARRSIEDGGLDYRGVCTTLEGICMEVVEWNREHGRSGPSAAVNGPAGGSIEEGTEKARDTLGTVKV